MNKLTSILQSLTNLHEDLLETSKKKTNVLVSGETQALLSILSEESKIVKQIQTTDKDREKLVAGHDGTLTLSEYIERYGNQNEKQEWKQLQEQLRQVLTDIKTINQTNEQLLKQSLSYTQYMMDQLLPGTGSTGYYRQNDTIQELNHSNRFFDAKA